MTKNKYEQIPALVRLTWKRYESNPDSAVVLTHKGRQFLIDPMGLDIIDRCNGRTTTGSILGFLKEKYPHMSPQEVEQEAFNFLTVMQTHEALVMDWDCF